MIQMMKSSTSFVEGGLGQGNDSTAQKTGAYNIYRKFRAPKACASGGVACIVQPVQLAITV